MNKVEKELISNLDNLVLLSENFPDHLKHKVLGIGMIGELRACHHMNWEHSDKRNNPGYDAKDKEKKIQIKTFVLDNKTRMLPAFNPNAEKNMEVNFIAIVVLNNDLTLNRILISSKKNYESKLKEVEDNRTQNSKSTSRLPRYDMTISQFETIKGLDTQKL